MMTREEMMQQAIWVAHSLFERNRTTGSSANISFRYRDNIFISRSGSCFGLLEKNDFVEVDIAGNILSPGKPSKELPIHLAFYHKDEKNQAVIHTHGPYAALLSCMRDLDPDNVMTSYTPYLTMKVGTVALVPYAKPGSEELFSNVRKRIDAGDALLLANHGAVVPGLNPLDAFYKIEELEESARINWLLKSVDSSDKNIIST